MADLIRHLLLVMFTKGFIITKNINTISPHTFHYAESMGRDSFIKTTVSYLPVEELTKLV